MKALEQLERLKRITQEIKHECTGSPEEFSRKLGISRRQLYAEIDYLRDLGVEISYSRSERTFRYCNGHEIEISYGINVIPKEFARNIYGGFFQNNLPCFFYAQRVNTLVKV